MIPKIIHYCWFGNSEYPPIVHKCLESWKKFLPDYEIKLWNETNIDVLNYSFMRDAYENGKWAFVSDYARFLVLKDWGGIFLDCDVEILRPLDPLLINKVFFGISKHEQKDVFFVNPGLIIGCEKNNKFISEVLVEYGNIKFLDKSGAPDLNNTSPRVLTRLLSPKGLKLKDYTQSLDDGQIVIYSSEYFDPINPRKLIKSNIIEVTENTFGIHHSMASWVSNKEKVKRVLSILFRNIFGDSRINYIKNKMQGIKG